MHLITYFHNESTKISDDDFVKRILNESAASDRGSRERKRENSFWRDEPFEQS